MRKTIPQFVAGIAASLLSMSSLAGALNATAFETLYEEDIGDAQLITLTVTRLACVGACAANSAEDFDPRFLFGVGSALTAGGGAAFGVGIGDPDFGQRAYEEIGTMTLLSGGIERFTERTQSNSGALTSFPEIGSSFEIIFNISDQTISLLGKSFDFSDQATPTRIIVVQGDDDGERLEISTAAPSTPVPAPGTGLLVPVGLLFATRMCSSRTRFGAWAATIQPRPTSLTQHELLRSRRPQFNC